MASLCGIDGCGKKSLRYGDAQVDDGKPSFRLLCWAHYCGLVLKRPPPQERDSRPAENVPLANTDSDLA
ncbi:MAG: hypothetical protein OK456_02090 [Thaumarchaeota archaeon]|nr:hypothetical protein [Nitrososphaerota archaeon]